MGDEDLGATRTLPGSERVPAGDHPARGQHFGRYVIEQELGRGGMGVVYRAHDPELGRDVAIKRLHPHRGNQSRLLLEGRAVAKLRHPNVITIYDVGMQGEDLFIAMELVTGMTLRTWLEKRHGWREIVDVFRAAGSGLAAAHDAGVVHRDFKPDNVLIGDDGRVLVTDFGLARSAPTDAGDLALGEATLGGALSGTPGYMSPEQFLGESVGPPSDQFSFCVALFSALHDQRPFTTDKSPEALRAAVLAGRILEPANARRIPQRLDAAIRRGLAVDPAKRFDSMHELLARLEISRRRIGPWLGVAAIATAGAVAFAVSGEERSEVTDPCYLAIERAETIWNPEVKSRTRDLASGSTTIEDDLAALDLFAARWKAVKIGTCLQGDAQVTYRRCLDRAIDQFATTVGERPLAQFIALWAKLPSIDRCSSGPVGAPTMTNLGVTIERGAARLLSPDGTQVASISGERLHVTALDGSDVSTHAIPKHSSLLSWPTGDTIRIGIDPLPGIDFSRVLTLSLSSSRAETSAPLPKVDAISDDGSLVLQHGELRAISADGSSRSLMRSPCKTIARMVRSPRATRIAILCHRGAGALGRLQIIDLPTGSVFEQSLLPVSISGAFPATWVHEDVLAISGQPDLRRGEGIWIIRLDPQGRVREPPELRVDVEPRQAYQVHSARGGRLLVERISTREDIVAVRAGTIEAVGRSQASKVFGVTRDGETLLAADERGVALISVTQGVQRRLPQTGPGSSQRGLSTGMETIAVAGDHLLALGSRWLARLEISGTRTQIGEISPPAKFDYQLLTCSSSGRTCLVVWQLSRYRFEYQVIRDDVLAGRGNLDLDHNANAFAVTDGGLLAISGGTASVDLLELAGGKRRRLKLPTDTRCSLMTQAMSWSEAGLFVAMLCGDAPRSRIYRFDADLKAPARLELDADRWIGGMVARDDGSLFLSRRLFTSDTILVEDL